MPDSPAEAVRPGLSLQVASNPMPDPGGTNEIRLVLKAPRREEGWRVRVEARSKRGGFVAADGSLVPAVEWDMIPGAVLRLTYRPGEGAGRYEERIEATAPELGYVASASFSVGLPRSLSVHPLREAEAGRFLPLEIRLNEGAGTDPGILPGRAVVLKILPEAASGEVVPVLDGEAAFRAGERGVLLFSEGGFPFGLLPVRAGGLSFRVSLEVDGVPVATAPPSELPVSPPSAGSVPLLKGFAAAASAGMEPRGVLSLLARGEPLPRALGPALSRSASAMAAFARTLLEGASGGETAALKSVLTAADRWGLLYFSREGLRGFRFFGAAGGELSRSSPGISAESGAVVWAFPRGERRMVRLSGNGSAPVRLLKILPGGVNRKEYPAGTWTKEVYVYGDVVVPPKP